MHIADGILPPPVWLAGLGGSSVVVAASLRWLVPANVPRTALLTAGFFAASLIHVPLGPVSIHLLLHGLVGIVLGPLAPLAIVIALALQAVLLQHGGIAVLGFNALSMSFGALLARVVFDQLGGRTSPAHAAAAGFLGGAVAVIGSALVVVIGLWLAGDNWQAIRQMFLMGNLPLAVVEGLIAGSAAPFIIRVKPELLRTTWPKEGVCPLHSTIVKSSELT